MYNIYIYYENGQGDSFRNVIKVLDSDNKEINLEKESIAIDLEKVTFFTAQKTSSINLKKMNTLQVTVEKALKNNLDKDLPF